jgi:hypothetical protein
LKGKVGQWHFGNRRPSGAAVSPRLIHESAFETSQRIATRFFDRCEERIDVVVMPPDQMTAAQKDFVDRLDKVAIA